MDQPNRSSSRRRWFLGLSVLVVLVVAVVALGPIVVGMQSQARLDEITTRASERLARLDWSIESFEQGAYGSRATTRMTWRFPEAQRPPAQLELRHRIHHGPRPDGLYWARVETVPVFQGEMAKRLAAIYGERDPVSATYTEGIGGKQSLRVRSPEVAANVGSGGRGLFTSRGFELSVERRKRSGRVTIDGELPGLELRADDGRIRLHELGITGELDQSNAVTTGNVRLSLAGLDLRRRPNGSREAGDFLGLRRLHINERLDERDGALAGRLSLEADDLALGRERYRDLGAVVGIDGIPVALVERINRAAREAQAQGKRPLPAMVSTLQAYPPGDALAQQPRVRLERIEAQTPAGPVRVDGELGVSGLAGQNIQGWLQVLLALDARLRVDVPERLARVLAARYYARQSEGSSSAPTQAELEALAAEQLSTFERKGWIDRSEGQVATQVTYEAGALRINGRRVIDLGRLFGE